MAPANAPITMRFNTLSLALPLLLLAACDTEPSGPNGPSGGENRFRVFIGEVKEPFDDVELSIQPTSTGTVTLRLLGSVDPLKNAVDDEYSLLLQVHLDKAALLATSAPTSLTVKGSATFSANEEAGVPEIVTQEMDPTSSPVVKGVFFGRSCFCVDPDGGEQTFDGTIQVDRISASEITGTLSIRLQGDVPNYTEQLDASLSAEFNLAIP